MPYRTRLEGACEEIENAQEAVAKAQAAFSRGGSCDAVNRANRSLADAHSRYREVSGGRVPDDR
jgi:hypothetical protein